MTDEEKDFAFTKLLHDLVLSHGMARVQEMYDVGDPLIVGPFTALRMTPGNADRLWRNVKRDLRAADMAKARNQALKATPEVRALMDAARALIAVYPATPKTRDLREALEGLDRMMATH